MVQKKRVPPKCPNCGKRLETVWETTYLTYSFDPVTGSYITNDFAGDLETRCSECESRAVENVFKEGVCNYTKTK